MFCKFCGNSIEDNLEKCPICGSNLGSNNQAGNAENQNPNLNQTININQQTNAYVPDDSNAPLYGILGFFIPLAGIILGILWHRDRPKRSRAAIIGFGVSFSFQIVCAIFWFVVKLLFW